MGCLKFSIRRNRKVLKVVKVDGKVIEFTSPVAVKEFEGFGVKSSRESSKLLPPSLELRLGNTYYLFPSDPPKNQTVVDDDGGVSTTTAVKRIKIVITKKQLEELLSKKTSVEKIIFGIHPNWKPSLVAIPEENEVI